jgi:hypothetical protein
MALPLAVCTLALIAWLAGWRVSALALVFAFVAWRLRLLTSTNLLASANLWDYLFDPLLVLGALSVVAARAVRRARATLRERHIS